MALLSSDQSFYYVILSPVTYGDGTVGIQVSGFSSAAACHNGSLPTTVNTILVPPTAVQIASDGTILASLYAYIQTLPQWAAATVVS